jgi:hypothetical protein
VIKVEIPEVETNIEPFTDTFIEARYSQHPVTYKQASQAHQWWNSLRKVILHKKPIR